MPPKKIKQQVLSDFAATIEAKPNLSKQEIYQKFPEFGGDDNVLQAAVDYQATSKSGKYSNLAELNSKFPEFEFEVEKKNPSQTTGGNSGIGVSPTKSQSNGDSFYDAVGGEPLKNYKAPEEQFTYKDGDAFKAPNQKPAQDDNANMAKPLIAQTEKDKKETEKLIEQKNINTQEALTRTVQSALKTKGSKAAIGSPEYNQELEKYAGKLVEGEAVLGFDEEGKPGLKRTPRFIESVKTSFNDAVSSAKEADGFVNGMDAKQRVEYVKKQQAANPNPEYIGTSPTTESQLGELVGGSAPFLAKAGAGAAVGGLLVAGTPITGGGSLAGLPVALAFAATMPEMKDRRVQEGIMRRYEDNLKQHPDWTEEQAMEEADNAKWAAAGAALVENAALMVGMKAPVSFQGKTAFGKLLSGTAVSAGTMGSAAAATTAAELGIAKATGENISGEEIVEKSFEAGKEGFTTGGMLHLVTTGGRALPKLLYSGAKYALVKSKPNPQEIMAVLKENEAAGAIPEGKAEEVMKDLSDYKTALDQVQDGKMKPEVEASVAGLQQKINGLVEKKTTDIEQRRKQELDEVIQTTPIEVVDESGKVVHTTDKKKAINDKYDAEQKSVDAEIADTNAQIDAIKKSEKPLEHEVEEVSGKTYSELEKDNLKKRKQELEFLLASDAQSKETTGSGNLKGKAEAEAELKSINEKLGESAKTPTPIEQPTVSESLKDVESTATAIESILPDFNKSYTENGPSKEWRSFLDLIPDINRISKRVSERTGDGAVPFKTIISEAYHEAKADGSNPELVKAVEESLGKSEPTKTPTTPPTISESKSESLGDGGLVGKVDDGVLVGEKPIEVKENEQVKGFSKKDGNQVVDDNGEPTVVYHGTQRKFDAFELPSYFGNAKYATEGGAEMGMTGKGIFFSSSEESAKTYSELNKKKKGFIKKAYVDIKNPYIIDAEGKAWTGRIADDYKNGLRDPKYDGVIVKNVIDSASEEKIVGTVYAVKDPSQIREIKEAAKTPSTETKSETTTKSELKQGEEVKLPPQVKGGLERTMIFDKGEWKQKVGDQVTKVSEKTQKEAQGVFDAKNQPIEPTKTPPTNEAETTKTENIVAPKKESTADAEPNKDSSGSSKEPPKEPKGEAVVEPDGEAGMTHADTEKIRKEKGLGEYEKQAETKEEWDAEADKRIADGKMPKLLEKMREGESIDKIEQRMMGKYIVTLDAEVTKNPTPENLAKLREATQLSDKVGGTEAARTLVARQGAFEPLETLGSFLLDKEKSQGFKMSEEQMKEKTAEYQEYKKANDELKERLSKQQEEIDRLVAEKGVNKAKAERNRASKKTAAEYQAERKDAVEAMRKSLKKLRGETTATIIPGANELAAIAPHVKTLVKSLVNEGIDKLDVIVSNVYAEIKDVAEGITKRQIIDVIAGKHDEVRQTKNEIAASVRLLKREADLVGQLERARKGLETEKSPTKKAATNRRIEELENQIKRVQDLNKKKALDEVEPVSVTQKNLLDKIESLEKRIKEKNYAEEKAPAPKLKLDRRTQILQDKVMELENKFRHDKAKDEYAKLSKWERGWDKVQNVTGIRRILLTIGDLSTLFRQLNSLAMNPRKWGVFAKSVKASVTSTFSQLKYDRIIDAIHKSEDFRETLEDGIKYNELDVVDPRQSNEMFQKSLISQVPIAKDIVKSSQRAADASLNVARYELYQKFKRMFLKEGITRESDPEAYKEMAKLVMNSTGSGNLLKMLDHPKSERALGSIFFGAKLMAATFNRLNPAYYVKMVSKNRALGFEAIKDVATYATTMMAIGLAAKAAGATIELDPDKPDFLQIRFGDKVYDITGGAAAYIRVFLRWAEAGHARATGSKAEANKATKFAFESTTRFFRNKLSPNTGFAVNAAMGSNTMGEDFTPAELLQSYPMWIDDTYKAVKDDGLISLLTVAMPNIIGLGYGNYYSEANKKDVEQTLERNTRSDEQDLTELKSYKQSNAGRDATDKEKETYIQKRDALIETKIKDWYANGRLILVDGQVKKLKYDQMNKDQIISETSKIKAAATLKIKKELFGVHKDTDAEKKAAKKLKEAKEKDEK